MRSQSKVVNPSGGSGGAWNPSDLAAGIAALCPAFAVADGPPSERDVRQAIEIFLEQPTTRLGRAAAGVMVDFVRGSDAVEITITPAYTPWIAGEEAVDNSEVFLAAFLAGSIRSQLDSGVKGNDAYAGMLQVFRVYRHLRAGKPNYRVSGIDELLALHRKGELAAHLAKAAKDGKEDYK